MTLLLPISIVLPLRTESENATRRLHWRTQHSRRSMQRQTALLAVASRLSLLARRPDGPPTVVLARISARKLDSDNLRQALKSIRDGVADALRLPSDSDELVHWHYEQLKRMDFSSSQLGSSRFGVRVWIDWD